MTSAKSPYRWMPLEGGAWAAVRVLQAFPRAGEIPLRPLQVIHTTQPRSFYLAQTVWPHDDEQLTSPIIQET